MQDEPTLPAELARDADESKAAKMVSILDDYLEQIKQGKAPSRKEMLAAYPELASELEACLSGIEFIHGRTDQSEKPRQLGEFRIVREVGRGGMGAVYEAEQISLGRKVALKVLRFGSISDPEAIGRFKREAETVATLHHTNIVPIFSVGSESGVNFYAMQFIEGDSLDKVAAKSKEPLATEEVTRWALEAAEALSHAHQRGVIHRDIKPSNLILDGEGRIWLTDFGLAKRADDVTLSMTGALLGTPRYMSPEQAATQNHRIDHRTDIYSLGATLYELLTQQPVFQADTPLAVISQILTEEPVSPSKLNPNIPRDLETILLKCLSKEVKERYSSAESLAADLRAVLEDRPIAARRASWVERSRRWIKKREKSVRLTGFSVAITLMVVFGLIAGIVAYQKSQIAQLTIRTESSDLFSQVLDSSGTPLGGPLALPTIEPVEVKAGQRRLHVQGYGFLSQMYDLPLAGGEDVVVNVSLKDAQLSNTTMKAEHRIVQFGDKAKIVSMTEEKVAIIAPGQRLNHASFNIANPLNDPFASSPGMAWPWINSTTQNLSGYGPFDLRPYAIGQVEPDQANPQKSNVDCAPDLDGDKIPDLVLAAQHQAWLLAISGKDGHLLWFAPRADELATEARGEADGKIRSASLYPPQTVGDLDSDGTHDILVVFGDTHSTDRVNVDNTTIWMELVSGADGKALWTYELDGNLLTMPNGSEAPPFLRWFVGAESGYTRGGGASFNSKFYSARTESTIAERRGRHVQMPTQPVVDLKAGVTHFMCGQHLVTVNLNDGTPARDAQPTGVYPELPPTWQSTDANGDAVALLVEPMRDRMQNTPAGELANQLELVAWSTATRSPIWKKELLSWLPTQKQFHIPRPNWPILSDLNHDGILDVVTPNVNSESPGNRRSFRSAPWGNLEALDGRTGDSIWKSRIFALDPQAEYFVVGPDLDDDQVPEIFVASLWTRQQELFVEALSGADGRQLWWSKENVELTGEIRGGYWLAPPQIWGSTDFDWPLVCVPVHNERHSEPSHQFVFSTGDGSLTHILRESDKVYLADADGDGVDDLFSEHRAARMSLSFARGGRVSVYLGAEAQLWRRFRVKETPFADLDQDGIFDLLRWDSQWVYASSGRDGHALWKCRIPVAGTGTAMTPMHRLSGNQNQLIAASSPLDWDLNGDGVPDIIVTERVFTPEARSPGFAISGVDGEILWHFPLNVELVAEWLSMQITDIENDGKRDVVFVAAMTSLEAPPKLGVSSEDYQIVLGCVSSDGKLRWTYPLSKDYMQGPHTSQYALIDRSVHVTLSDLNNDNILDVLVFGEDPDEKENSAIHAVDGAHGNRLWSVAQSIKKDDDSFFAEQLPITVSDLDGDGQKEVIVSILELDSSTSGTRTASARIEVRSANTGALSWMWSNPVDYQRIRSGWSWKERNRVGAQVVRLSSGQKALAWLLPYENEGHHIMMVNAVGDLMAEQSISPNQHFRYPRDNWRLWVTDTDGDGDDEFICGFDNCWSCLSPDDFANPIWYREISEGYGEEILHVYEVENRSPQILFRSGPNQLHLVAVDSANGQNIWSCGGLQVPSEGPPELLELAPMSSLTETAPLIFQATDRAMICRQATPSPRVARFNEEIWSPAKMASRTTPTRTDPRRLRRLPWVPPLAGDQFEDDVKFWAFGGWLSFILFILPVVYLYMFFRHGRFGLLPLAGLVPLVGLWILFAYSWPVEDSEIQPLMMRMLLGLVALPVVTFLCFMARNLFLMNLKAILVWSCVLLVATLAWAGFTMQVPLSNAGGVNHVEERYGWDMWYLVFVGSTYITGVLIMLVFPFKHGILFLQSRRRRWINAIQPNAKTMDVAETEVGSIRDAKKG